MAITVYTYNDKVLKNVATDKWLKKPEAPAGFVMNAANAVYHGVPSGYGTYITVNFMDYSTSDDAEADLAKIEFRILD